MSANVPDLDNIPYELLTPRDKQRLTARASAASTPSAPQPQPFSRMPAPVPQPSSQTQTEVQRANAEMAQLSRDRADGKISDVEWDNGRRYMELAGIAPSVDALNAGTPGERSARQLLETEDATQAAIEKAVDASMPPPKHPFEYNTGLPHDANDQEMQLDRSWRRAMFDAGVPRDLGNRLAETMNETAGELQRAGDPNTVVERNERVLRERWGDSFDAKVATVRAFLLREGTRSPIVREWFGQYPELFSSPNTMGYLLQLAERAQRRAGAPR